MILSYIMYVILLYKNKPNSKMLKSVKDFASSRKVRTFALPIGRKAQQHYQSFKFIQL